MEGFQRQLQALSEQCLSHEVKDQLMASEIRYNRKQLQEEYGILVNAFEFLQVKHAYLLRELLNQQDEEDDSAFKKRLYCVSDVVEDQSTPSVVQYTRKHLEEDYGILMYAFEQLQETQACMYMQLWESQADKDKALAECMERGYLEFQIVQPEDVKDLLMASEKQFTRQQLKEDQDTLIKACKVLQEKHELLWKQLLIRKDVDDEVLTDSKKQMHHNYQRGLVFTEQSYEEEMVAKIKFTRKHIEEEYDVLIRAFKDFQAKQMCLLKQEQQEDLNKQDETECEPGLSNDENYESMVFQIKFTRKQLQEEYDTLIEAFKHLHAKACLLDQQMFILVKPEDTKKQRRNKSERGDANVLGNEQADRLANSAPLGGELMYDKLDIVCEINVDCTRKYLEADCDTLIKGFKDFQAKLTSLLGEKTAIHREQEENHAGPKRQYRTEYERGLSNVVKDRLLHAVNPGLERNIELLIIFRKNLQVEAASWLEKLCSRPAEEEVAMTSSKKQWYDVYGSKKVQLPQNLHPELEGTIERLIAAHQNLEADEARLLEELSSRRRAEEEAETNSMKQCPSNVVKDWLPHGVNPELERTIELLVNAEKNIKREEACLLEKLSRRQQTIKGEALTDPKEQSVYRKGKNLIPVQDVEV